MVIQTSATPTKVQPGATDKSRPKDQAALANGQGEAQTDNEEDEEDEEDEALMKAIEDRVFQKVMDHLEKKKPEAVRPIISVTSGGTGVKDTGMEATVKPDVMKASAAAVTNKHHHHHHSSHEHGTGAGKTEHKHAHTKQQVDHIHPSHHHHGGKTDGDRELTPPVRESNEVVNVGQEDSQEEEDTDKPTEFTVPPKEVDVLPTTTSHGSHVVQPPKIHSKSFIDFIACL